MASFGDWPSPELSRHKTPEVQPSSDVHEDPVVVVGDAYWVTEGQLTSSLLTGKPPLGISAATYAVGKSLDARGAPAVNATDSAGVAAGPGPSPVAKAGEARVA